VFPASKIQNVPERCAGSVPEWHIQNVLTNPSMMYHFWQNSGTLWGHCKDMSRKLENSEHFESPCNVLKVSQNFAENGTSWTNLSGHSECATREHFRRTVLAHFEFYWLGTLVKSLQVMGEKDLVESI
jgi:hypothetical protein